LVYSKDLKEELKLLKQEKVDDEQKYLKKANKMERIIQELNGEKSLLEDRVDKLESSKTRMERILK